MKITDDIIKALKPCADRYENFTNNYPTYSGWAADFLSLENIDYDDKVWVMSRLMTKAQNLSWAVSCAYSVLPIFEKEFPDDTRPRELLKYMSSLKDCDNVSREDLNILVELRKSADAASCACRNTASMAAALAAVHAAEYIILKREINIACSSYHVVAAYANAACVVDAYDAGYAHEFNSANKAQQDLNLKLLLEVLCKSHTI